MRHNHTLRVATHNISRNDESLFALIGQTANLPDIVCVQECNWNSREERRNAMQKKGFILAGATKGAERNDVISCIETYIRSCGDIVSLQPNDDGWRCSSCSHEVTYLFDRRERRREMALSCNLVFQKTNIWIINLHLATKPDDLGFSKSCDWHWKYSLPELGMWYNDKEVIIAGDWNFDAPAAFGDFDVVGLGAKFDRSSNHSIPIFGVGLQFFDCQLPTHQFSRNGKKLVRVDAVGYRRPPYPQVTSGLKFSAYEVIGELNTDGHHLPVIASFEHS